MKTLIRVFVVTLAISGSVAYTQISSNNSQANTVATRVNSMPIPTCPPDDANACGIVR